MATEALAPEVPAMHFPEGPHTGYWAGQVRSSTQGIWSPAWIGQPEIPSARTTSGRRSDLFENSIVMPGPRPARSRARPQRSSESSEDEERGRDARDDQTAREPDQAQRSVATLVLQQTLRFGGSVDTARQLAMHGVGLGECERTTAERGDRDTGRDVRHRPLRPAGPGFRLWKRSGRGHRRDWRLFVEHGWRGWGRREQRSAFPGRRGGLLPRRWRRLRFCQRDGGRLGGRQRVPSGARQRWIHPGAGGRGADVRQRQRRKRRKRQGIIP